MKFSKPKYTYPESSDDFRKIVELQKKNLPVNISEVEAKDQGFVTVQHTAALLKSMNDLGGHALAKVGEQVVGYALFMSKELEQTIPLLSPMFEQFKKVNFNGSSLYDCNYFVMGQVCIDKDFRSQGVFGGLYDFLKQKNKDKYNYIVTEVATRNTRSIRAHKKVGFELANVYRVEEGEEWAIVVLELN